MISYKKLEPTPLNQGIRHNTPSAMNNNNLRTPDALLTNNRSPRNDGVPPIFQRKVSNLGNTTYFSPTNNATTYEMNEKPQIQVDAFSPNNHLKKNHFKTQDENNLKNLLSYKLRGSDFSNNAFVRMNNQTNIYPSTTRAGPVNNNFAHNKHPSFFQNIPMAPKNQMMNKPNVPTFIENNSEQKVDSINYKIQQKVHELEKFNTDILQNNKSESCIFSYLHTKIIPLFKMAQGMLDANQ